MIVNHAERKAAAFQLCIQCFDVASMHIACFQALFLCAAFAIFRTDVVTFGYCRLGLSSAAKLRSYIKLLLSCSWGYAK